MQLPQGRAQPDGDPGQDRAGQRLPQREVEHQHRRGEEEGRAEQEHQQEGARVAQPLQPPELVLRQQHGGGGAQGHQQPARGPQGGAAAREARGQPPREAAEGGQAGDEPPGADEDEAEADEEEPEANGRRPQAPREEQVHVGALATLPVRRPGGGLALGGGGRGSPAQRAAAPAGPRRVWMASATSVRNLPSASKKTPSAMSRTPWPGARPSARASQASVVSAVTRGSSVPGRPRAGRAAAALGPAGGPPGGRTARPARRSTRRRRPPPPLYTGRRRFVTTPRARRAGGDAGVPVVRPPGSSTVARSAGAPSGPVGNAPAPTTGRGTLVAPRGRLAAPSSSPTARVPRAAVARRNGRKGRTGFTLAPIGSPLGRSRSER